ncbi:MAG: DUF1343 domain-containing protein [Gemmatimonadota bacterium]
MHRTLTIVGFAGWAFACAGRSGPESSQNPVRPGLQVLLEDSLHLVLGRRVGLVTNQGGVDAAGVHAVERLRGAGVNLVALFSPEHGFRGTAAPGEVVSSARDSASGLPIYSLYGRTSSPTDSMLRDIDVMLVDLPDVGARYYTYLSTTVEVMKAAGRRGIPVIILDRPNPIGGAVQGNVLDTAYRSFVGLLAMPMRHGMTLGELARLAQSDLAIRVTLAIVPVSGWERNRYLDQTGLPFIRPSPNLSTLESLFHYPGLCLVEGTNLSVGRGSDAPFEQVGAPWLDTTKVLDDLRRLALPGVQFSATHFTPSQPGDGKYADTLLAGIRLRVTNRDTYDPTRAAVELLSAIFREQPDRARFTPAQFDRLAGDSLLRTQITEGVAVQTIVGSWVQSREQFEKRRREFLIY